MVKILNQIILCQSKYDNRYIYIRVKSEDVCISSVIKVGISNQTKCDIYLPISETYPLSIEIWNYEPHKLLKQWNFNSRQVASMKNKHMLSDNNWILYLKSNDIQQQSKQNKEIKMNKSRSCQKDILKLKTQTKMHKSKKKRDEINLILQSKSKSNKQNIKKALKNTICYLIKQQSMVDNFQQYGMGEVKSKTGKCTPASEQFSSLKNYSNLFSQYGLDITEVAKRQLQKSLLTTKVDYQKKIRKIR